jgi:two-component system, OmpR family, phosphate regulon sensor histidine kinase PhoR
MQRRKIFRQFLIYYIAIVSLSLAISLWYTSRLIKESSIEQARTELTTRVRLVQDRILPYLISSDSLSLDTELQQLGSAMASQMAVFRPDGRLVATTGNEPGVSTSPGLRPEITAAVQGNVGSDQRYNRESNQEILFVAVPVTHNGQPAGIVRIGVPLAFAGQFMASARLSFLLIGALVILLSILIGVLVSRKISAPIQELRLGAERFARGDLSVRVTIPDSDELAPLGEAMNEMARQLDERIRTITLQRNEQEAILASMVEGMLAVDADERIMNLNRTASQLFGILPADARGRTIQEVVRNLDLQRLISETIRTGRPVDGSIIIAENGEQHLQAHGTILRDAEGRSMGALLVLHDITQLKKLESVRRDFVANVSHELKTPITSIKGFVETLQDGAVHDPEDAERFLGIISKHADRLNAIIEDLLALSRIEQDSEREEIVLEPGNLLEVITLAVQACSLKAKEKDVQIAVTGGQGILVRRNAVLLEQAVINLLDNAIKYSETGGQIEVSLSQQEAESTIAVQDHGCGIGREHLSRLWERFYRVDRARSRTLGGTGLGLAIVKHIVLAHGGRVAVDSVVGQGSVFTIILPVARESA